MSTINFKRGDSLSLAGTYKVDGVASSVAAMTIRSQVRDFSGELVQELSVVKTGSTGEFTLLATAAQTMLWDVTTLKCDIEFSEGGSIRSSETFSIIVSEDITK